MKNEKTEVAVIDLDLIDVNKLPELANFKERGLKLVKECKFVEISDNSTYEIAKKNRTALRTFRTDVEKSDKAIKSKLNSFKNRVGEVSASLIAITEPAEKTQQEEVERYEQIKENERLEKLRLEQERVDNIKKSISEFRIDGERFINTCVFESIDATTAVLEKRFSDFDRLSLGEFEVLFNDAVTYLKTFLGVKANQLLEQENIRIQQIELEKERERQRVLSERIAEEQRKEREKLEAEKRAEEEKIRLAKESFEKEKREFEEKQAEAKYQERIKQITDAGCVYCGEQECFEKQGYFIHCDDIKNASDELWERELEDAKNAKFSESALPSTETQEVEFEEVKSEQSANEDYHEADVDPKGLSTRLKANTPANEKESLMYLPYVKIWEEENIIEASIKFKKEDFESFSDLTLNQVFGKFTLIKND